MEEKLELVIKDDTGALVLSKQVETVLDTCEQDLEEAQTQYDCVKQLLIDAMLNNNIKTANVGKYKLSVREPKEKWTFNKDKFIAEENEDIIIAFSKVRKVRTETFDMDKLKTEFPEVYAKCLKVEEHDELDVDDHKLWETLTKVWEKYATKEEAKAPTINIKKVGE